MSTTRFIVSATPSGNERAWNTSRLASAVAGQERREGQQVRLFLKADAVARANSG